jgi:hypothetical protein
LNKVGKWVGVGLADESYLISGGTTLGAQVTGLNSSYFWQDTGIRRIQMYGEPKKDVAAIFAGDIITVVTNFKNQRVYYYKNRELQVLTTYVI